MVSTAMCEGEGRRKGKGGKWKGLGGKGGEEKR